ncbi:MAG: archease [Kiritimatiellaeota bacterium]|nr:archease [Kiritimatiellota bacterium]
MPYRFVPEITRADIAFEAWAESPEELIRSAADALLAAMLTAPARVRARCRRRIRVTAGALDLLLYRALEEILFLRDADGLLVRYRRVEIRRTKEEIEARIEAAGEPVEAYRGEFATEIKAITFHELRMAQDARGLWRATVVVDA